VVDKENVDKEACFSVAFGLYLFWTESFNSFQISPTHGLVSSMLLPSSIWRVVLTVKLDKSQYYRFQHTYR